MDSSLFPCPACGFLVFSEPPGSYEICDVCGWEDDPVQLRHQLMGGGANKQSLAQSQAVALHIAPVGVVQFREFVRDPSWRPLSSGDLSADPSPRSGLEYCHASADETVEYYWRGPRGEG